VENARAELLVIVSNPTKNFMQIPATSSSGFGNQSAPMIDPLLFQKIASNPEVLRIIQNPTVMEKFQQVMTDPSKLSLYQNDRDFMSLIEFMSSIQFQK